MLHKRTFVAFVLSLLLIVGMALSWDDFLFSLTLVSDDGVGTLVVADLIAGAVKG